MKYLLIFILGFIFVCVSIVGITVVTQKMITPVKLETLIPTNKN